MKKFKTKIIFSILVVALLASPLLSSSAQACGPYGRASCASSCHYIGLTCKACHMERWGLDDGTGSGYVPSGTQKCGTYWNGMTIGGCTCDTEFLTCGGAAAEPAP